MKEVDLSDGVDYIRFCLDSEKGAPSADYEPVDGSIKLNLDEMWDDAQHNAFVNPEGYLIETIIDSLGHELCHKWYVWGMGDDFVESFNEQDERIMRVVSDWIFWDKKSSPIDYDYK